MEYLKTYVEGLDEKIKGGIPKRHVVLISGPTGSMKSTLSFYIAYRYLESKKKGNVIYVSLEQSRESLLNQMKSLNMDIEKLPSSCEFNVFDWGLVRKMVKESGNYGEVDWVKAIETPIKEYARDKTVDILILDSLNALYAIADMVNPRNQLFFLFESMREVGATTFVISETSYNSMKFGSYDVEGFLADGIIHLSMERVGRTLGRYISIIKMRGVKHSTDYYPLLVDERGFRIVSH